MENQTISQLSINRAKQFTHKFIFDRKKELNLSNYRLAQIAGINRQIIDSYTKEPLYNLTLENYFRICGALNLRPYLVPAELDNNEMHFEHFN